MQIIQAVIYGLDYNATSNLLILVLSQQPSRSLHFSQRAPSLPLVTPRHSSSYGLNKLQYIIYFFRNSQNYHDLLLPTDKYLYFCPIHCFRKEAEHFE